MQDLYHQPYFKTPKPDARSGPRLGMKVFQVRYAQGDEIFEDSQMLSPKRSRYNPLARDVREL